VQRLQEPLGRRGDALDVDVLRGVTAEGLVTPRLHNAA